MAVSEDGGTLVSTGRDKVELILHSLFIMLGPCVALCYFRILVLFGKELMRGMISGCNVMGP